MTACPERHFAEQRCKQALSEAATTQAITDTVGAQGTRSMHVDMGTSWSSMLRTMRKPDLLEMRPKLASQKRSTAWSAWSSVRSAQGHSQRTQTNMGLKNLRKSPTRLHLSAAVKMLPSLVVI